MRVRSLFLFVLLAVVLLQPSLARAELRIDITRGKVEPLPIAVTDFVGSAGDGTSYGQQIAAVVAADLERSGLFAPIDNKAFIDPTPSMETLPTFANWRVLNAQALVQGRTFLIDERQLRVEFRLWDVFAQQQMTGLAYVANPGEWRRIAHIISDSIYKRLTGEDGYFDTRIVYISQSGSPKKLIKRLAVMDQDGANHSFLTDGTTLVLTPRFSPDQQEISYLAYYNNTPRVYIFNLETGRHEVLGDFPNMTFAPRFSPDGKRVIMSMSENGNSEVYVMDLSTRAVRRLTNHSAIDTAPSFSPDAKAITFESDRGGTQQIYVMDSNGANVRRISFGEGRYATPVWSPRGDLIAFTKILKGRFYIGVMRPDGSGERLLADGYLVESPTWAPNGRVLMFFRENPTNDGATVSKIFTIDLTGHNERQIITPAGGSDPAWSPLIP
ncbi:Tol-Pal system beta propeller repeat protein TolB [Magnetospira thiophila]